MSEKFRILEPREAVLLRPAMYIGSVTEEDQVGIIGGKYCTKKVVPGLLKIVNELIDNSVDEAIRTNFQHANQIDIVIKTDIEGWSVGVEDNGRGIPVVQHDGVYQAELCWTRASAGTSFTDDGRVTIGANGVGSFCANVFSKQFLGISGDGTTTVQVDCSDNLTKTKTTAKKSNLKGTKVVFYPDLERFGLHEISEDHIDVLRDRIANLAICYPKIKFNLFTMEGSRLKLSTFTNPTDSALVKVYHDNSLTFSDDNYRFLIAPSGADAEFRHLTYLNGLHIRNGGSHVDYLLSSVVAELQPMIKRKWKIDIAPNQIRQGLLVCSWVRNFPNPKFDSQTKERITNSLSEVKAFLQFDATKIAKKIIAEPAIIDPIIQATLYKKELADRLALAKSQKSAAKKKIPNHIVAQAPNPEDRTLMICEGLSAIGPLIAVRDAKKVGGYSLRGKILNTRGMKYVDIAKNKELSELMAVIGLELGKPAVDLNYGKIAVMSDADTDGDSIFCLLLNFFSNWPELFVDGRIARCMTPLFVCTKGKDEKWFYSIEEFEAANLGAGWSVKYNKGLGSLHQNVYKKVVNEPKLMKVSLTDVSELAPLEMAFGDDVSLRKEWLLNV